MYHNIFDTHAHYDHHRFNYVRHAILSGMPGLGVSLILNCGSDEETSLFSAYLASEYSFVYSAAGIHPHNAAGVSPEWESSIKHLLSDSKTLAVGEIGLDYHYNFSDPSTQRKVFAKSLEMALSSALPVIVHDRDAHGDVLAMLREYRPKGVVHRFSGDPDMMEALLEIGLYLGFGCSVMYPDARNERETVTTIPIDRLLLETDCPYILPPHSKEQLSRSDMIGLAAETIAELRCSPSVQEIIDSAAENGRRLFGIGDNL